ncbi:hypothetical protein [Lacticaseibacillus saniviri]|uniref:hypothetical protein n=1 Tax=Lacticaseibacillus saniviri TaxID=931533 RepID=UPI0034E2E0FA
MASRIPNRFNFEDYTLDELAQIGLSDLNKNNYTVNVDDYTDLIAHNYGLSNDHSNGRWIRNLNEQLLRKVAVRLARTGTEDLSTITAEDILATKL